MPAPKKFLLYLRRAMPSHRKRLITEISAQLFLDKGYNATTMRDIAEAVGVEAASLYNHIKSKHDLLQTIVTQMANICNEHLEYVKQKEREPITQIESLIRFHVKLMVNNFTFYYVMTHEWKHLEGEALYKFAKERKEYVQSMELIVQKGIDKGAFKNLSPYVVVLNILSAVMGLEFWHRSQKKYSADVMENDIVNHLLSGLVN
jgi:TetR/AcrR family transcriptional regulator, cholesterol catabolism regulator